MSQTLQPRVEAIGGHILSQAKRHQQRWSPWARQHQKLMSRLMRDDELRVQVLRFVDVLPTLGDDETLVRLVEEYFDPQAPGNGAGLPIDNRQWAIGNSRASLLARALPLGLDRYPAVARWALRHARQGVAAQLAAGAVRRLVERMALQFIAGHDLPTTLRSLTRLRRRRMAFSLDILGEASVNEREAAGYRQQYLRLIHELAPQVQRWPVDALLDTSGGSGGSGGGGRGIPRLNVSVKVSSLYSQLDPIDPAGGAAAVKEKLRPVLRLAREQGASVTLDMEQYNLKALTIEIFKQVLTEEEFRDWPDAGIALQAYLHEGEADVEDLIAWAKRRGTPVLVRLVRGAYWDYETTIARQNDWAIPVWTEKAATDATFESCTLKLLASYPAVDTAVATHNVRSLALAIAKAEQLGLRPGQYELQMLYGMADPVKRVLAEMGQRLRVYVPFGKLIPGMAYLVRRLLENTASQSVGRLGMETLEEVAPEVVLAPPGNCQLPIANCQLQSNSALPAPVAPSTPESASSIGNWQSAIANPFRNEPPRRFTDAVERAQFAEAIARVRGELGRDLPMLIGEQERWSDDWLVSVNPASPAQVVGRCAAAGGQDAAAAVGAATAAFPGWRDTPAERRAELLLAAAGELRRRRDELAAWQIFEAGKPWRDADGDVTEAIDFLEYYAREAVRLDRPIDMSVPGEANHYLYEPRGVVVVIAPWNFPLAIWTGMAAAALAAGNTVVLKPAPQTPVIAGRFVQMLRQAGLPPGVINFLPGGDDAGEALVRDPRVHVIAFTGSQAAGCAINEAASRVGPGQDHIKRVIAEMGGKNAIIVDETADLDEAVLGVTASAFGYAGQKCSACARVIVVGKGTMQAFLPRLIDAARSIRVGPPEDPGTLMGPVIDEEAYERILRAIEQGKQEARCELLISDLGLRIEDRPAETRNQQSAVRNPQSSGYFLPPTIFTDVPPAGFLAQTEIFGPVLAVVQAADLDEALRLALGTRFALTGGIYSRSPAALARAAREFRVGNLYMNRRITGAIVGRQPFGGLKMSGIGSKAGGPDYLLQFLQPRVVTENTLRRGFAPETGVESP